MLRKIDRSKVRELVMHGLTDQEIADELNCVANTIFKIRCSMNLYKNDLFYLKEWRKAYERKSGVIAVYLNKTLMRKLGFKPEDKIYYRTSFELPGRVILDLRLEKDIDLAKVKKRRWSISSSTVTNVESPSKRSEG